MNKAQLFAALVLISLSANAAPVKIMTWNLEWYPGRSMTDASIETVTAQVGAAKAILIKEHPDVFIAQEMRDWKSFDDLVIACTGLTTHVVSSFRGDDTGALWHQQIGIASRLPCLAAWQETWDRQAIPGIPRGFVVAALLETNSQSVLLVYGVHLKSNRAHNDEESQQNYAWRTESARQLIHHMEQTVHLLITNRVSGIVVAGDFNTNHDEQFGDSVIRLFTEAGFTNTWLGTDKSERRTWRGNKVYNPTTFDYILTRATRAEAAKVVDAGDKASDHWPVTVTIHPAEQSAAHVHEARGGPRAGAP